MYKKEALPAQRAACLTNPVLGVGHFPSPRPLLPHLDIKQGI